jgi:hypothetical protein
MLREAHKGNAQAQKSSARRIDPSELLVRWAAALGKPPHSDEQRAAKEMELVVGLREPFEKRQPVGQEKEQVRKEVKAKAEEKENLRK